MNPMDRTEKGQSDTLTFEWDLPHSAEKVWRALTDPELVAQWLLPAAGFDLAPGAKFTLHTDPQPGWDGVVHCAMLKAEQPHRLSYTWVVGELNTVVTFELEPTATGTLLSLNQSGFRLDQKRNFGGARYGWRMMGEQLVEVLDREG